MKRSQKRDNSKRSYESDPEPKRAQARDHSKRSYESNPEPKKAQARDHSQRSYESDPESKRAQARAHSKKTYDLDSAPKRKRRRMHYEKAKEHRTSLDALKEFRKRGIHGPIFLCLFCAEFKFRCNVERFELSKAEDLRFMDAAYNSRHALHFKVLESHWACTACLNEVEKGKIPARSTANIFPDETPERFKDITDVENSLAAPVIVFVKLHNLKNNLKNTKTVTFQHW